MIHATIRMCLPPDKEEEALRILVSIVERTLVESGCINCRIYRDVRENRVILLEELWESHEDLEHHLRTCDFRSILLVVEMAEGPPEIRFDTIANSSGFETIEKARSKKE